VLHLCWVNHGCFSCTYPIEETTNRTASPLHDIPSGKN
jgi:hypothetical protein